MATTKNRHFQRRPLPQIAVDQLERLGALGEYALLPTDSLKIIVRLMSKMYAEERMDGDEMRDAAQWLDFLLDQCTALDSVM